VIALIHHVLSTYYDTTTRKPKRGAYGEYLKCSENTISSSWSQNLLLGSQRHKTTYDQTYYERERVLLTASKTAFMKRRKR